LTKRSPEAIGWNEKMIVISPQLILEERQDLAFVEPFLIAHRITAQPGPHILDILAPRHPEKTVDLVDNTDGSQNDRGKTARGHQEKHSNRRVGMIA
jgi:hypothetical protein